MADERPDPTPDVSASTVRSQVDRIPGQRDMSAFEQAFAGPSAAGPRVQWLITWPDGQVTCVDSEDDALAVARGAPVCRIARRYVSPHVPGRVPPAE